MGKMKQGINGPFTGRVGTVVGNTSYDGLDIMRSVASPSSAAEPFTAGENTASGQIQVVGSIHEANYSIT